MIMIYFKVFISNLNQIIKARKYLPFFFQKKTSGSVPDPKKVHHHYDRFMLLSANYVCYFSLWYGYIYTHTYLDKELT